MHVTNAKDNGRANVLHLVDYDLSSMQFTMVHHNLLKFAIGYICTM